ncbi:isocitrate lyase/phosphoenolpyruvate mutase family protein [Burkholderia sp. Ac-20365]|jgi:2-methylisocitrate lyase-like PEP mutase family enzyme|uniref:isocitrate lyase/PEP mutase family protein n=1 Tax=Burkholderia sp. Ac-20365 TaxID=2703897 RepID=UPI00197B9D90|nr:isocitrate lyase/phosphoenolpyruvate mutase family protein [Burkholderia sp. Ac-20365]MBN3762266.1 isocitrate lyase/phosphoenolpyruvate mutase family protein [Burkholderia sp. Ac-20365]
MSIANTFRQLHTHSIPLRLPNVWDAGSARLVEAQGASAIATTSAGFAWALGYPDGRILPFVEVVAAVRRIVRVLNVPLSVDIEHGYSDDPKAVADHVMRLMDLGIAGINIEDGPDPASLLASKIEAIKNALANSGSDLFVNARSDVFLAGLAEKSKQPEESIVRGNLYASAGADGLFLPALMQASDIEKIASATRLPLNVMAVPGLADAATLGKLGVRRLSAGSGISQVVLGKAKAMAQDFLQDGRSETLDSHPLPYSEIQNLFAGLTNR